MRINKDLLNCDKFYLLTKDKWKKEPLEYFACENCDLIVVGIPFCHIAFVNPSDLSKSVSYNLPKKVTCPNCRKLWYEQTQISKYNVRDISIEELLSSDWGRIFSKKV